MNHSKKRSSLQELADRNDGMIQRRTTVSRDELPVVPMFPSAVESLGCEGDGHVEIDQKDLSQLPEIPVFVSVSAGTIVGPELVGKVVTVTEAWPPEPSADPEPSPTPAELPQPAPGPATSARWALWSDGSLEIRGAHSGITLGPALARELQRYLAKMGGAA